MLGRIASTKACVKTACRRVRIHGRVLGQKVKIEL